MRLVVLGYNCTITFALQELCIKQSNSLFEWWLSPQFSEVLDVLEKCLKKEPLVVEYGKCFDNHSFQNAIIRTSHYIGKTGEQSVEAIVERRAKRLHEFLESDEQIVFLRNEEPPNTTTFEEAKRFKQLIANYYPSAKYVLILLQTPTFSETLESVFEFEDDPKKYIEYIMQCVGEVPPKTECFIHDLCP